MKIVDIRTIPVSSYLFVQVHTDEGITGLGESGAWGYLEASEKAVETFKRRSAQTISITLWLSMPCALQNDPTSLAKTIFAE